MIANKTAVLLRRTQIFIVVLAIAAAFTGLSACKDSSDKRKSNAANQTSQTSSPQTFRTGDDTAAGRMLSALGAMTVPRLDGSPACAAYARNMRSLLSDTSHQLHRLREQAKTGMPVEELNRFAGWLESRSAMLTQVGQAKALQENELGRVHREFTAAVTDLAYAASEAYPGHAPEPDADVALKLDNATSNFVASANALETQCKAP